ncbi:hypothetical protein [Streptomyces sp. KS 21]|uniref:hypothetical protein n=1 Tax=Streptomyces sp. KS 21 TaxID=2485150 RepID=UPI001062D3D3|nr:hypothetical protein [Streptomyces sp. KS 21]TDU77680.1 hypothetical protein EDD91_4439 [Streptomyces sp. KS 21]
MALTVNAVTVNNVGHINGVHRYDGSGSSWTKIQGPVTVTGTFGGGWGLITGSANADTADQAFSYNGSPFDWQFLSVHGALFAITDDTAYKTAADGSAVFQFDGFGDDDSPIWSKIGDSAFDLVGGRFGLIARMPNSASSGHTFLYTGNPGEWQQIGPMGSAYAVSSDTVYRMNGGTAFQYDGVGSSWTEIGSPNGGTGNLYAGGFGLFTTTLSASGLFRYGGNPGAWERVGDFSLSCAVTDDTVYRVGSNGSVFQYDGSGMSWTNIGRPDRVVRIVAAGE